MTNRHGRLRYYRGLYNFGDDINPILWRLITGEEPETMDINDQRPVENIIMCGSILGAANKWTTVWGSGFVERTQKWFSKPEIAALRGPITLKMAQKYGLEGDVPLGDPVMVIKKYYQPWVNVKYKYGVIPHYADKAKYPEMDDVLVIDIQSDIFTVIDNVWRCENIISSSLHGLVVADTYQRPSMWVRFSNNIWGDGMKFYDYFGSVGRDDSYLDMRARPLSDAFKMFQPGRMVNTGEVIERLMEVCPLLR